MKIGVIVTVFEGTQLHTSYLYRLHNTISCTFSVVILGPCKRYRIHRRNGVIPKTNLSFLILKFLHSIPSRGISCMKYVNERRTGLVTFCVETAFYNGVIEEKIKGEYRSDRKTRKKT